MLSCGCVVDDTGIELLVLSNLYLMGCSCVLGAGCMCAFYFSLLFYLAFFAIFVPSCFDIASVFLWSRVIALACYRNLCLE